MVSFFENSSYEMTNIVITKSNYAITVVFIIKIQILNYYFNLILLKFFIKLFLGGVYFEM